MELTVDSLGGDRHRIRVRGHELIVDQPRESGGEDAGPTPVDLFVASLAACVAHYARRGLGRGGAGPGVRCSWAMSEEPPWRVAAISVEVMLPPGTTEQRVAAVRRAVAHCTVRASLADPPSVSVRTAVAPDSRPAGIPQPAAARPSAV
ncbi:MAG: OsmC family protein [Candidatus Dormiibacterota bacterium]